MKRSVYLFDGLGMLCANVILLKKLTEKKLPVLSTEMLVHYKYGE